MPESVKMPALGESVTEGTITRWLKNEGDRVEADEPLVEVSTDKVDTEIPSPASGVVSRILVPVDEVAAVGAELAIIDGDGGDGGGDTAPAAAPAEQAAAEPAQAEQDQDESDQDDSDQAQREEPAPSPEPEDEAEREAEPASEPVPDRTAAAPEAAEAPAAETTDASPAEQAAAAVRDAAETTEAGVEVKLPALGESVTEGTVTRWLKSVGDEIAADEPLLEISTDKVDTEIPSPAAGTLQEIRVAEDEVAEVGTVLAVIGTTGAPAGDAAAGGEGAPASEPASAEAEPAAEEPAAEEPAAEEPAEAEPAAEAPASQPTPAAEAAPAPAPSTPEPAAAPAATAAAPAAAADGAAPRADAGYVTPLVRKLATDNDIDLSTLSGTGIGGRIRKQDVQAAIEAKQQAERAAAEQAKAQPAQPAAAPAAPAAPAQPEPSPLRGRTEKLPRMRALIARRMMESLQNSAQLTTVVEVDVTRIARLRDQVKQNFLRTHGVKLSFLPFFALATVEALRVHPNLNATLDMDAGTVTYFDAEHLGIAVDTGRGLVVPVIRDAGDLNLAGLARRIADVAERTRDNKISPDELSGGTFTLTNTGSRGALFDTPIINQPQVAILGTGTVVKRAVVVEDPDLGEIILPRSMVYLALTYDHRLVDGADAMRFLGTVKERLEAGNFEAEFGLG